MKNSTAIFFACHQLDWLTLRSFHRLHRSCHKDFDVILSCYGDEFDGKPHLKGDFTLHVRSIDNLKRRGYRLFEKGTTFDGRFNKPVGEGGIWANPEMFLLDFFCEHPDYEFYWLVEYDVRFTGKWRTFFEAFSEDKSDLLGTKFQSGTSDPNYHWWGALNFDVKKEDQRSVFFPIVRFSRRAVSFLHDKYSAGVSGFSEVLATTLLHNNGFSIGEVEQNRWYREWNFYYGNIYDPAPHRPPMLFYSPLLLLSPRNKLVHPVKNEPLLPYYKYTFNYLRWNGPWILRRWARRARTALARSLNSE